MTKIAIFIIAAATGCAADHVEVQPRLIQPGDALSLSWTTGQNKECEDCTPRAVVECGHEISHPCPYLLFTTVLGIEGDQAVFGSATGGSDANGVPAENHLPVVLPFVMDGDALTLDQRGDDGGLRHAARLTPFDGGYAGDIEYSLFNVAGYTTFHLSLTFKVQQ